MNPKLALATIVAFAAIMGLGLLSPVMAAPSENANPKASVGKVKICHWQEEVLDEIDPTIVLEEAKWVVIDVSKNAEDAHIDVHTPDDVTYDQEITDVFTETDCDMLNPA